MTSFLRRKLPTTRRGRTTRRTTAASLAALALAALAAPALAQPPRLPPPPPVALNRPVQPATPVALPTAPPAPLTGPTGGSPKPAQPVGTHMIRPAAAQDIGMPRPADGSGGYVQTQLDPPGPDRLFRLESERDLQERIRQEQRALGTVGKVVFPDEPVLSKQTYDPTWRAYNWPGATRLVEPQYVCHGRLPFQQLNAERYGWDLGPIHPAVAGLVFFKDVACLPYNLATDACRCYDCNSGYCLPGDPVPLLLYPMGLSASGTLAEAGTIALLCVIFP